MARVATGRRLRLWNHDRADLFALLSGETAAFASSCRCFCGASSAGALAALRQPDSLRCYQRTALSRSISDHPERLGFLGKARRQPPSSDIWAAVSRPGSGGSYSAVSQAYGPSAAPLAGGRLSYFSVGHLPPQIRYPCYLRGHLIAHLAVCSGISVVLVLVVDDEPISRMAHLAVLAKIRGPRP